MSAYVVKKSIRMDADPMTVWNALTDPEKTKKYFFNARVISDWRAGSPITFKGKMFYILPFEMSGNILRIEPGKYLKYTLKNGHANDDASGLSTVTDVLFYENGQTILTITDDVGDGGDAEKRYQRSEKGWDKVLAGLKKLVEA